MNAYFLVGQTQIILAIYAVLRYDIIDGVSYNRYGIRYCQGEELPCWDT